MFDISWAELGVVMAVGVAVVGRKDLPAAARTAGDWTGRAVGWLQGMRSRADRFTAQHELAALQNQVRSSMRQLQAVQAEVLSASSVQSSSHRAPLSTSMSSSSSQFHHHQHQLLPPSTPAPSSPVTGIRSPSASPLVGASNMTTTTPAVPQSSLPPVSRTSECHYKHMCFVCTLQLTRFIPVAAVAESEWSRQGLGFTSRAELGNFGVSADSLSSPPGSFVLAKALQESLVHDQYDRVVREQQEALNADPATSTTTDDNEKDATTSSLDNPPKQ